MGAHKKGAMVQAIVKDGVEEEIPTSKVGWNPKEAANQPVLLAGWNIGSPSHHSISLGMALACKDLDIEGLYLGDFTAVNEKGEDVLVPVLDPIVLNEAMQNAFCTAHHVEYTAIRMAASRSGAKKELASIREEVKGLDQDVLDAIKEKNPALYAKLIGEKVEVEPEDDTKPEEEVSEE